MSRRILPVLVFSLMAAGCEPLAMSVIGAGASTALRYNFDGITYRTFTAPAALVKGASIAALERMGLEVLSAERYEAGELIVARSAQREVEIEVEPVSSHATRIRITAKTGGFVFTDGATANEIIAQTQRILDSAASYRDTSPGLSRI